MAVSGKGLAALGAGSILVWSGIKGWSVLGTAGDLITGVKPSQTAVNAFQAVDPSTVPDPGSIPGTIDSGLAGVAQGYIGHAYKFGGAPGADGSRPWDCSSFVNFCASIRMGLAIPGYGPGKYNGSVHGPPTGLWGIWPGLTHVSRADVRAGDLIVWTGHMGVAISNSEMVSALNEKTGTQKTAIEGHGNGPILCYGRYNTGSTGPQPTPPNTNTQPTGPVKVQ